MLQPGMPPAHRDVTAAATARLCAWPAMPEADVHTTAGAGAHYSQACPEQARTLQPDMPGAGAHKLYPVLLQALPDHTNRPELIAATSRPPSFGWLRCHQPRHTPTPYSQVRPVNSAYFINTPHLPQFRQLTRQMIN